MGKLLVNTSRKNLFLEAIPEVVESINPRKISVEISNNILADFVANLNHCPDNARAIGILSFSYNERAHILELVMGSSDKTIFVVGLLVGGEWGRNG